MTTKFLNGFLTVSLSLGLLSGCGSAGLATGSSPTTKAQTEGDINNTGGTDGNKLTGGGGGDVVRVNTGGNGTTGNTGSTGNTGGTITTGTNNNDDGVDESPDDSKVDDENGTGVDPDPKTTPDTNHSCHHKAKPEIKNEYAAQCKKELVCKVPKGNPDNRHNICVSSNSANAKGKGKFAQNYSGLCK